MCAANPAVLPVSVHSAIFNASSHPALTGTWRELEFNKYDQQSCCFTMALPRRLLLILARMRPYGAGYCWSSPRTLANATVCCKGKCSSEAVNSQVISAMCWSWVRVSSLTVCLSSASKTH